MYAYCTQYLLYHNIIVYTVTVTIGTDLSVLLRSTALVSQPYTLVSDLWPPFPSLSWPYMVVTVVNTSPVFSFLPPSPTIADGYIRHRSAVCVTTVVVTPHPPPSINSRRNNCTAVGCSGNAFIVSLQFTVSRLEISIYNTLRFYRFWTAR